jgi:MarR family transcriptional regulator for hemolysin
MDKLDPNRSVGFLMHEVARMLRAEFTRQVEPLGLTQAQWQTLAHLSRNEGLKQAQLADILEIRPITLTRLIDRLQAAGLVERRSDPDDRRAQRLFLTEAAQPLMAKLWKEAARVREKAMAGLPQERRELLIDTLAIMKANLSRAEAEGRTCGSTAVAAAAGETKNGG